jgi:AbrB family looped-hinge helix DNA binding protein
MVIAKSKVTRQGQISVPAEVRRDLGIQTGSELIWERQDNGDYVVRLKRATLDDLHRLLGPSAIRLTDEELREARRGFAASRIERSMKGR